MFFALEENRRKYILDYYTRKREKTPLPSVREALSPSAMFENAQKGVFMLWPIYTFQWLQRAMRYQQSFIAKGQFPPNISSATYQIYQQEGLYKLSSKGAGSAAFHEWVRYATLKGLFITHAGTFGNQVAHTVLPESFHNGFSAYGITCAVGGVYGSMADLILAPGEAWKAHNTMRTVPLAGEAYDARLHGTYTQSLRARYQAGELSLSSLVKAPFRGAGVNLVRQSVNTSAIIAAIPAYECGAKYALGLGEKDKLPANVSIVVKILAGFTGAIPAAPLEAARVRKYMPGSKCERGVIESLKDLYHGGTRVYVEQFRKQYEQSTLKTNLGKFQESEAVFKAELGKMSGEGFEQEKFLSSLKQLNRAGLGVFAGLGMSRAALAFAGLRFTTAGLAAKMIMMSMGGASKAFLMEEGGVTNLFSSLNKSVVDVVTLVWAGSFKAQMELASDQNNVNRKVDHFSYRITEDMGVEVIEEAQEPKEPAGSVSVEPHRLFGRSGVVLSLDERSDESNNVETPRRAL